MAEQGWQSLKTAPKDGRPILSWDGDTYAVVVWCGCRQIWALGEGSGNLPHGATSWEGITHWHPLPKPPHEMVADAGSER